jgi:hypothetical protein
MRWMVVAGLLLGSGVALADNDDQYRGDQYQYRGDQYRGHEWQENREARLEQRREEARQELQQRLDACNGRHFCRRHAYRDFHREMARIDRYQF